MTNRPARPLPGWAALSVAIFAATGCDVDVSVSMRAPRPIAYEALQAGDTIAVFPDPSLDPVAPEAALFAGTRRLAPAIDEESIYLLDPPNHRVHRIGLDGTLLASFGGEGQGPGELERPVGIQGAAGGGVWVLHGRRATHFQGDGSIVETLSLGDANVTNFAPTVDGALLIPAVAGMGTPDALLTHVSAEGIRNLENPARPPERLVDDPFRERFIGWRLAPLGSRQLAIVLNGAELRVWRAFVSEDGQALDSVSERSLPQRPVEAAAEAVTLPDARLSPVARAGISAGHLWVVTPGLGWGGPLAFTVPLQAGDPSLYLDATGLHEPGRPVRDLVVLSDRIVVARDTEVVIRSLQWPAESSDSSLDSP